jgi:chemotaxis protein histidine kinase CheA
MATLSEYFENEARDYLAKLERDLERSRPDAAGLQRVARALRGSAQMAREERVFRAAGVLEAAARAVLEERIGWSDELAARARATVADLRVLVDRRQSAAALDAVADGAVARWRDAGISLPVAATERMPDTRASASREFRAFTAREVTAIAEALDRGVQQLAAAPMDREPLKMILRRQRVLLGATRLEEIPVVAEILRAVDDLTRVIAKLDVGVKREWLDIYRIAREALRATIQPLQQDEEPRPSHALSRLRHMREELLERYGAGEAVSAAHESAGFTQATTLERAPDTPESHEAIAMPVSQPQLGHGAAAPGDQDPELLLVDEAVLELEDVVDDGALELAGVGGAATLVLEEVADEPVLELDRIEDEPLLELIDVADEPLLELDEGSVVARVDEAAAGLVGDVATEAAVPIETLLYERDAALRRALELRDLVALSAIDPVTHEAIDELFDLIGIALH